MLSNDVFEPEIGSEGFDGFDSGAGGGIGSSDKVEAEGVSGWILFYGPEEPANCDGHVTSATPDIDPMLKAVIRVKDRLCRFGLVGPIKITPITREREDEGRNMEMTVPG